MLPKEKTSEKPFFCFFDYIYKKGKKIIMNTELFVKKSMEIHGGYDYSKTVYVNPKTLVKIICPKHGEFEQLPYKHMNGHGCRCCANERRNDSKRVSTEQFIERAMQIHGDKYDYSKVNVTNINKNKVIITCSVHGDFEQTPNSHLSGKGCPQCGIEKSHEVTKKTTNDFIKEAIEVHGKTYSYEKVDYINNRTKVVVTCPIHGDFEIIPLKHTKRGDGCPKCRYIKSANTQRLTTERFIERAKKIHGDKYSYEKTKYVEYDKSVIITCPIHGDFEQTPDSHLQGSGCQKCSHLISKKEIEISDFITNDLKLEVVQNDRTILKPKEIDIFIPSKNIAIEYNGLKFHSEEFGKDKMYHLSKLVKCNEKSIKLIQIFEDEYINRPNIVKDKIAHILGVNYSNKRKIMARKCSIQEIESKTAKNFLNEYHIQGQHNSTIYLGCVYNNELIGVMAFKREKNDSTKWELTRFATNSNYICQGVGGKLFKFFTKNYNPSEIKSFADRRWTLSCDDNLYTKIGFELEKILKPDYRYYSSKVAPYDRIHKFNFRKEILSKKYGLSLEMTEKEMVEKLNYYKVWDCGLLKYVWRKTP